MNKGNMTISEAAEQYPDVPRGALYHAARTGQLQVDRTRFPWRVTRAAVEVWKQHRRGPGKPRIGEITQQQAADMLGVTTTTVRDYIRKGHLPRALTARAVVQYALERKSTLVYDQWRASARPGAGRFAENLVDWMFFIRQTKGSILDWPTLRPGTLEGLFVKMERIAPLTEWRVVRE